MPDDKFIVFKPQSNGFFVLILTQLFISVAISIFLYSVFSYFIWIPVVIIGIVLLFISISRYKSLFVKINHEEIISSVIERNINAKHKYKSIKFEEIDKCYLAFQLAQLKDNPNSDFFIKKKDSEFVVMHSLIYGSETVTKIASLILEKCVREKSIERDEIDPDEDYLLEGWSLVTEEEELLGVGTARHKDSDWSWTVSFSVCEYVREEPLESKLHQAIRNAIYITPGVIEVIHEDREVWVLKGNPKGPDLINYCSMVLEDLVPETRECYER